MKRKLAAAVALSALASCNAITGLSDDYQEAVPAAGAGGSSGGRGGAGGAGTGGSDGHAGAGAQGGGGAAAAGHGGSGGVTTGGNAGNAGATAAGGVSGNAGTTGGSSGKGATSGNGGATGGTAANGVGGSGGAGEAGGATGGNGGTGGETGGSGGAQPTCGDGVKNGADECDGADLGGATCDAVLPKSKGALRCNNDCKLATGGCVTCGDDAALQADSPWPMVMRCPSHPSRGSMPGPSSGTSIKWKTSLGGAGVPTTGSPVIAADGTIYVVANDTVLTAIGPSDGAILRTKGFGAQTLGATPAIAADGTLWVAANKGSGSTSFLHVDKTFAPVGEIPLPMNAALPFGGVLLTSNGHVYAGDALEGYLLIGYVGSSTAGNYMTCCGGSASTSPALLPTNRVVTGGQGASFVAVDVGGGSPWSAHAKSEIHSSPTITPDGTSYFGDNSGTFFAVDAKGTVSWSHVIDGAGIIASSPALGTSDDVFFSATDGSVYHHTASTGARLWATPVGAMSGSMLIDADDNAYVLTTTGLVSLTPDGKIRYTVAELASQFGYLAMGKDGTLYGVTGANEIFALSP